MGDPASLRRAIGFYEQAVALDSAFVPAWAQLARARAVLYTNGTPTPELASAGPAGRGAGSGARPRPPRGTAGAGRTITGPWRWTTGRRSRPSEAGLKLAPNNVDLLVAAALAEQRLGQWNDALQHLAKASALDPRSANTARRTGVALLYLRRYPEAYGGLDRGLALAPTNLAIIEQKAMVALAQGDLRRRPGSRAHGPQRPSIPQRCSPSSATY